ncbi:MAG: porin family protein [Gemmatimonadales bacterium]
MAAALGVGVIATHIQAQITVGARGGVSVASASLDIEETFSQENRTGFTGGAFLDFNGGIFGVQVGAQYTQKGSTLDINQQVTELSLANLEIPAVVKVGIPLGMLKPSVFGGAGMSLVMSCDANDVDCKDDVKSTEWQGIAGADLAIYLGGISIWVDGRYHFGLSNISEEIFTDLKNKHWTFQGGIGFGF